MADGFGSFASKFAEGFQASRKTRLLRDELAIKTKRDEEKAARQEDQFNQRMEFQKSQASKLEEHRAKSQALQQKQFEIQQRQADVTIANGLMKAFDPKLPKSARTLMLRQVAKAGKIDTKGEDYKEMEKALMGLDDEAMGSLTKTLSGFVPDAQPGEIMTWAKTILSGNATLPQITDMVTTLRKDKAEEKTNQLLGGGEPAAGGSDDAGGKFGAAAASVAQTAAGATALKDPVKLRMAAKQAFANNDRDGGMKLLAEARAAEQKPPLELKSIADSSSSTGERFVPEEEAIGAEAPGMRPVATVKEQLAVEEGKQRIEEQGKFNDKIDLDADVAVQMAAPLEGFERAMRAKRFTPGTFGGTRRVLSEFAELVGMSGESAALKAMGLGDPAAAEFMEATANSVGLILADKMSRLTNMSLDFVKGSFANLSKTPAGNELIIDMLKKTNERALDLQQLKEKYWAEYGTMTPEGKPSFMEAALKMRRQTVFDDAYIAKVEKEARKGQAIDFKTIADETLGVEGGKLRLGGQEYTLVGKHEKGFPMVEVEAKGLGTIELPVVQSLDSLKKLPPNTEFLWVDKDNPTGKRKRTKKAPKR